MVSHRAEYSDSKFLLNENLPVILSDAQLAFAVSANNPQSLVAYGNKHLFLPSILQVSCAQLV